MPVDWFWLARIRVWYNDDLIYKAALLLQDRAGTHPWERLQVTMSQTFPPSTQSPQLILWHTKITDFCPLHCRRYRPCLVTVDSPRCRWCLASARHLKEAMVEILVDMWVADEVSPSGVIRHCPLDLLATSSSPDKCIRLFRQIIFSKWKQNAINLEYLIGYLWNVSLEDPQPWDLDGGYATEHLCPPSALPMWRGF